MQLELLRRCAVARSCRFHATIVFLAIESMPAGWDDDLTLEDHTGWLAAVVLTIARQIGQSGKPTALSWEGLAIWVMSEHPCPGIEIGYH